MSDKIDEVVVDEEGEKVTELEARREEKRLEVMMEEYFAVNPSFTIEAEDESDTSEAEDDLSTLTVSVSPEGDVLKETSTETKKEVEEVIVQGPTKPSFFEQELYRYIIEDRVEEVRKGIQRLRHEDSMDSNEGLFSTFIRGDVILDNALDAAAEERSALEVLLFKDEISFDDLEDSRLSSHLKAKAKKMMRQLFLNASE